MTRYIDLNADMGESFGAWQMGDDAALLEIVSSANIACGFHASDPDVMASTMRMALEKGVGLGAHPGFADLQGFGRRRMELPGESLQNLIRYQLGAAQAMARASGGHIRHFKLHGALANMASEDLALARFCYGAALEIAPKIILVTMPNTAQQQAAKALGGAWAGEIYADRTYNDDATLQSRALPGAVIHDAQKAAARVVEMLQAGAIITASGKHVKARIDTVCLHGDNRQARAMAGAIRTALQGSGLQIRQMPHTPSRE